MFVEVVTSRKGSVTHIANEPFFARMSPFMPGQLICSVESLTATRPFAAEGQYKAVGAQMSPKIDEKQI